MWVLPETTFFLMEQGEDKTCRTGRIALHFKHVQPQEDVGRKRKR